MPFDPSLRSASALVVTTTTAYANSSRADRETQWSGGQGQGTEVGVYGERSGLWTDLCALVHARKARDVLCVAIRHLKPSEVRVIGEEVLHVVLRQILLVGCLH